MFDEKEKTAESMQIVASAVISLTALLLMLFAQSFTPDFLNPFGCFFFITWLSSGVYCVLGFVFSL